MVRVLTEVPMFERGVPIVDVKRRKSTGDGKRCRREKAPIQRPIGPDRTGPLWSTRSEASIAERAEIASPAGPDETTFPDIFAV